MTTTELSRAVWRAYDMLAQHDEPPGSNYSPLCLAILRTLVRRPGLAPHGIGLATGTRPMRIEGRLRRMAALGLIERHARGWALTWDGRAFVALIDREGIT